MEDYIGYISKKIAKGIGVIIKAREVFDKITLLSIYNSLILLYIGYCIHIWGNAYQISGGGGGGGGGGVGPALAHHRCCRPDVGPALDWPASLSGRWRMAGRGLCVNCSLHLNMQNIIISVKTIIIIIIIIRDSPMSKHWLYFFLNSVLHWVRYEHSIALVAEKNY